MKIKAVLTILISLVLGFIIGFMVSQELIRYRTKDVQSMSSNETFKSRTYAIIEPDDQQKAFIDPVIEKYSEKLNEARGRMKKEYHDILSAFHDELRPFLNESQIKRLEEFPKHFKYKSRDTTESNEQKRN